ncbi:hypothetical protein ACFFRR_004492 [Megaselia abdita]
MDHFLTSERLLYISMEAIAVRRAIIKLCSVLIVENSQQGTAIYIRQIMEISKSISKFFEHNPLALWITCEDITYKQSYRIKSVEIYSKYFWCVFPALNTNRLPKLTCCIR